MSALTSSPAPGRPGAARPSGERANPTRRRLSLAPRLPAQAPKVPFVILLSGVMLLGVIGLLMFNTSMQQAAFSATNLQGQRDHLAAQEQALSMQLEDLGDPQRIAEEARSLGMVPVTDPAFLELPSGKIIGDARPASPQDWQRIEALPPTKPKVIDPDPDVTVVVRETNKNHKHKHKNDTVAQSPSNDRNGR